MDEHDTDTIRAAFPNARWMPWDDPPVGAQVRREGAGTGVVVGRFQSPMRKAHHDCPCCRCPDVEVAPEFKGWWIVRWDDRFVRREGLFIVSCSKDYPGSFAVETLCSKDDPGSFVVETLEWPPSLEEHTP